VKRRTRLSHAIVYTVRMGKKALDTAPSDECFREVERGYLRLAIAGNRITESLRAQGFAAYPGTAMGGLSHYSRVAELAGLGTLGYHDCVITPGDGALLRLSTVCISIENVPRRPPEPTDWIRATDTAAPFEARRRPRLQAKEVLTKSRPPVSQSR
jgi:epoxyqueuosine reductase